MAIVSIANKQHKDSPRYLEFLEEQRARGLRFRLSHLAIVRAREIKYTEGHRLERNNAQKRRYKLLTDLSIFRAILLD